MVKIGNIELGEYPLLLAPMEDVSDPPFRKLCKAQGADMVYTEFISADGLVHDAMKSFQKLDIFDYERPIGIQYFGGQLDNMIEAAEIIERKNPDVIDINFGCPVAKVACRMAGAGLLRDIPQMLRLTEAVVKSTKRPVTVKTRLGWDDGLHQHRGSSGTAARRGHRRAHHTRPHPRADVQGRGRLELDRAGQGKPAHDNPRLWKWRRGLARKGARLPPPFRRRRHHDRAGQYWLPVDFSGDQTLLRDRRTAAATGCVRARAGRPAAPHRQHCVERASNSVCSKCAATIRLISATCPTSNPIAPAS
jgi:hypothetical protein